MEKKNILEKAERIAVIFASLLGAIAFVWQVAGYISSKQERVNLILWCHVQPYAVAAPQLSLVVNISERPIYVKQIQLWLSNSENSRPAIGLNPVISPTIGSVYPKLDLIDVGASRAYDIQIDIAQLGGFQYVYLVIDSATGEIRRTENLASQIEDFAKILEKEKQESVFLFQSYQCNQR